MTKKITFNCPIELYQVIDGLRATGKFGTLTDVILTALRDTYIKSDIYFKGFTEHKKTLEEILRE